MEKLKETYKNMEERLQFVQADVTKKEDLHKMVEEAISVLAKLIS